MKYILLLLATFGYIIADDDIFYAIQTKNIAKLQKATNDSPSSVQMVKDDSTTYMAACANDFASALDYLKSADLNAVNQKGYSALMICSMLGNAEMVDKMSKMGANVNLQNSQGKSALMLAAFYGNVTTIKVLLKNGANKDLVDDKGWRAVDFAKAKNKQEAKVVLMR